MAIASLLVGIFGLCCLGIPGPVALYLGITSNGKIRDTGGAMRGAGLATTGIVFGVIGTVELVVLTIFLVLGVISNNH
jgi:Domain of unknown function (DUF4190)